MGLGKSCVSCWAVVQWRLCPYFYGIDVSDCGELGILGLPAKNFVVFFQVFFLL